MENRRNGWPKRKSQTASTDYSSMFYALWNLYNPDPPQVQQNFPRKHSQSLSREDALRLFPIGTTVAKESGKTLSGQVYDYRVLHWRVQYKDNDWEELLRREVHRMARSTPRRYPGAYLLIPPRRQRPWFVILPRQQTPLLRSGSCSLSSDRVCTRTLL